MIALSLSTFEMDAHCLSILTIMQNAITDFRAIGGDPSELMSFMVKNPGMIPTLETVRAGDIGRRRTAMREMFDGFWRACVNTTDDEKDVWNLKMMGDRNPFVADGKQLPDGLLA